MAFPTLNAIIQQGCAVDDGGKLLATFNGSFLLGFGAGDALLSFLTRAAGYPVVFVIAGMAGALASGLLSCSTALRMRARA